MLGIESEAKLDNPLDSDNLITHLKKAISPLPVSIPIKLAIYKQYEKQAVNSLFQLYQTLNKQLIENDILPKIPSKMRSEKTAADRASDNLVSDNLNLPFDEAVDYQINNQGQATPAGSELFNSLLQLLTRSTAGPSTAYTTASGSEEQLTSVATHQSLLSVLSSIQH